jgi:hypothetical protein
MNMRWGNRSLSPRLGFFVYKGLELEPEILFMVGSGADPVYMLNGNISYNFISKGKVVPYIHIPGKLTPEFTLCSFVLAF